MFPSQWKKYKFTFESYVINVISSSMGYLHFMHVKSRVNVTWIKDFITLLKVKQRIFFFFLHVLYSTLLNLPPLRFHCVGGCWDRTQDWCDLWHWQSEQTARSHSHMARSHPHSARSHPHLARSHPHSARARPHSVKGTKAWDFSLNLCQLHVHLYSIRINCKTGCGSVQMKVKVAKHW